MLTLLLLEFRNKLYANDPNYFPSQGIADKISARVSIPGLPLENHPWCAGLPVGTFRSCSWPMTWWWGADAPNPREPPDKARSSQRWLCDHADRWTWNLHKPHAIATRWETLRTQITMIFLNCSREIWHQSKLLHVFVRYFKIKYFPWQGNRIYKFSERLSKVRYLRTRYQYFLGFAKQLHPCTQFAYLHNII